jgi:euchromatic histone-lysine N-methyltransferase
MYDHYDIRFPHIALFANRAIPAGSELGHDYGERFWVVKSKKFFCACGSANCKYSEQTVEKTLKSYKKKNAEAE